MNDTVKRHLVSTGLTAASAFSVELLLAMQDANTWSDVGWLPLLSAASFVAVRAALKAAFEALPRSG